MLQENSGDIVVPSLDRMVKGSEAVLVRNHDVGSVLQEQVDHLVVAVLAGKVQRSQSSLLVEDGWSFYGSQLFMEANHFNDVWSLKVSIFKIIQSHTNES